MTVRTHTPVRRGAILLIVLVLLALFAVIGLTFVIYSQSEATNARIHREAGSAVADAPDATAAVNRFFHDLLYDAPDNGLGVTNAMRGHSLGRLAYGYNPATIPSGTSSVPVPNGTPYGGVGNFREPLATIFDTLAPDRLNIINFSTVEQTNTKTGGTFPLIDPEHTYNAANPRTAREAYDPLSLTPPQPAKLLPTGTYVGKNAAYTYPDRNNVYLAQMDPTTGRIVVPSFHRPDLFGSLDSANPNWIDTTSPPRTAGRHRLLRPRPYDHIFDSGDGRGLVSDFPYPPRNPDGTITGDVQNYRWGDGVQSNDSLWLYTGMAPVKWRERLLQPMVAALILPLDGRVNLNMAGNRQDSTANPQTQHSSQHGFTPHEINMRYVMPTTGSIATVNPDNDAMTVVNYRNNNQTKPVSASKASSVNSANFIPANGMPLETMNDWSPLNWDTVSPRTIPNTTALRHDPVFPQQGWDNNQSGGATRHPSLFNPYFEFDTNGGTGGGRTLRLFDFRDAGYKYSTKATTASTSLYGLSTAPNSFSGAAPQNPSNRSRALVTPVSNSLSYYGAAPAYANMGATSTNLVLNAGAPGVYPQTPTAAATPLTYTAAPTGTGDTVANQGWRSALALMGPVNLNRPLADYRGPGNMNTTLAAQAATPAGIASNVFAAHRDRHELAKDIMDRLVVATGAACDGIDAATGRPIGFATVAPGTPQHSALRYLAQIAVNIVDQIDNDDISTAFVWNPRYLPSPPNPPNTPDPQPENTATNFQPGEWENRVVYGCEKSRLVLNEVYAEITNDPADPGLPQQNASQPLHVRFHVEVLNPLNAPITNRAGGANPTQNAPLGDGSAPLRTGPAGPGGHSAYRILVLDNTTTTLNQLYANPANITGAVSGQKLVTEIPLTNKNVNVEPNDGQLQNTGFRHLAPQGSINSSDTAVYAPADTAQVIGIGSGSNQLHYTFNPQVGMQYPTGRQVAQAIQPILTAKHSVVLQKLANPYLTFNPANPNQNPWITIDSHHDITVRDAVRYGRRQTLPPQPGIRTTDNPDPAENARHSHSRRAPLYGYRGNINTPDSTNQATFAMDMPRTMAAHNNTSNPPSQFQLAQTFEWLNHLDRKLINQTELLSVAATKPHEQLQYFVTTAAGKNPGPLNVNDTDKQHHLVPWHHDRATGQPTSLVRALSMLQVKPFTYAMPHAGRQPGRVNINAIWHKDVLTAMADPNGGSLFTTAEVDGVWNALVASGGIARTPSFPNVQATVEETGNPNGDKPFKSLGVENSRLAPDGVTLLPPGVNSTILRPNSGAGVTDPAILLSKSATRTHHYQQEELLRKLYNNTTTTTDTYMVLVTIGYFEIRGAADGNTRFVPYLGKEAFAEIPGDLRVQYGAVVDRSMMATLPLNTQQPPNNLFFTELVGKYDPPAAGIPQVDIQIRVTGSGPTVAGQPNQVQYLTIDYEGRTTKIVASPGVGNTGLAADESNTVVFGNSASALPVRLPGSYDGGGAAPNPPTSTPATFFHVPGSGVGTIRFPAGSFSYQTPLFRSPVPLPAQPVGTLVSNNILGNPGPQASFDVNSPAAQLMIRELTKLR